MSTRAYAWVLLLLTGHLGAGIALAAIGFLKRIPGHAADAASTAATVPFKKNG